MPFSPPPGLTFHTLKETPLTALVPALRRVVAFLQSQTISSPRLRLYHDWWQHDGLHFDKGAMTFHRLFEMIETPRAVLEATPDDHEVFVGVAPEDGLWYLRFRAGWDADDQNIVGKFAVTVPSDLVVSLRSEIAGMSECPLAEESAASFYTSVMK